MALSLDSNKIAYVSLIFAVIFWGLSFVATKVALNSFPTFTLIFARFGLGASIFLAIIARRGFPRFQGRDRIKVFCTALFEPGIYFFFETKGLQYTTAPQASLIIALVPVVVLVLAAVLLKERPKPAGLLGLGLSLTGIVILVLGDPDFEGSLKGHFLGNLLIFGAVLSAALYIVSARDLGRKYSTFEITSMQTLYGAVFYAPAFLWEFPAIDWNGFSLSSLGALAYLTLFSTVAAFLLYNQALTRVSASKASIFLNGVPLVTALGAWVVLGEHLALLQAGGGLLVLGGVFLASLPDFTDMDVQPVVVS